MKADDAGEVIELRQKELQRVKVIENPIEEHLSVKQASQLLNLSRRQLQTQRRRYRPKTVD